MVQKKSPLKKVILLTIGLILILFVLLYEYNQYTLSNKNNIIKVSFINQWTGFELSQLPMIKELLEEKYHKIVIDHNNYDIIIDGVFGNDEISNKDSVKLFFTGEAIKPNIDKYDLSIGFNHIEHEKYMRIPLYYMFYTTKISTNFKRKACNPDKPFFACFLVTNSGEWDKNRFDGCIARDRIFHRLSLYKKVTSGGRYLNNINSIIPKSQTNEWLSNCKFVIAYENQKYDGYITEKPFQAYIAGSVPIYYSDNTYTQDVNPESVIFAGNFKDENALVKHIIEVDNNDELYCKIYNSPIILKDTQNYEFVKNKLRIKLSKILNHL